jgi:hypothetical protein
MLGNIALRGPNGIDDFLNTGFLLAEDAKNFQA